MKQHVIGEIVIPVRGVTPAFIAIERIDGC